MTLHGRKDGILIGFRQGAESVCQSRTDDSMGKFLFGVGRESGTDL